MIHITIPAITSCKRPKFVFFSQACIIGLVTAACFVDGGVHRPVRKIFGS